MAAVVANFRKGARKREDPRTGLQSRRVELDLTQEELGARIGRSGRYIGLIENGQHLPPDVIVDLLAQELRTSRSRVRDWLSMPRRRRPRKFGIAPQPNGAPR